MTCPPSMSRLSARASLGCFLARSVVYEAADRIRDLVEHGVQFDLSKDGIYDLTKEGGHSESRILHSRDRTGAEIERALTEDAANEYESGLRILEDWMVLDLVRRDLEKPEKGVAGLWCLAPDGKVYTLASRCVVLASGGAGMLHLATTNPSVSTGDGVAMAHRLGADICDMEFIQFHPTALAVDSQNPFLITEAMRGHGAILMTRSEYQKWKEVGGDPAEISYMNRYSEKGSLDTRDVVARATDSELKRSGDSHVLLVTEHLDVQEIREEFPTIANKLAEYGGQCMKVNFYLDYTVSEKLLEPDFMALTASLRIPYLRRWYTLRERLLKLFPEQKMDYFWISLKISFTGEGKNLRN